MRTHLTQLSLGAIATLCAWLALSGWTIHVSGVGRTATVEPLFSYGRTAGIGFVVAVVSTVLLAEAVAALAGKPRQGIVKAMTVVAGVTVVGMWAFAYSAQVASIAARLAPAAARASQCGIAGMSGCPQFRIGDGAIYGRIAVSVVVLLVVYAVRSRWAEALLASYVSAVAFVLIPHVGWYLVTSSGAKPQLFLQQGMLLFLPFVAVILLWWGTAWLGFARRWWWFVVGLVLWAVSVAVMQVLGGARGSAVARLRGEGMPVAGDLGWDYPYLFWHLLVPVFFLVTWLTERRRARNAVAAQSTEP